jgi:hypothetical protein
MSVNSAEGITNNRMSQTADAFNIYLQSVGLHFVNK